MGTMSELRRLSIIALAVTLLLGPVLVSAISAGSVASAPASKAPAAIQYDLSAQLRAGTVFDNQSSVMSVDPNPRDFAVGDLNNDSLKDVAVISSQTNSICIYNRTATGGLSSIPWRISKPGVVDMRSIAIGDLNNDGLNDIVVSYNDSGGNGNICIFNQSASGFTASNSFTKPVNYEPWQVVIGHFDSTSNYSVATVCMGDRGSPDDFIDIWRYPFTTGIKDKLQIPILASPGFTKSRYLAAGDANNDGLTDLIAGNESGNTVFIALQKLPWKTSWTTKTKLISISSGCSDLQLTDVSGAGRSDLVFADSGNSKIWTYLNDGTNNHDGTGLSDAEENLRTPQGLGSVGIGEMTNGQGVDMLALSKTYSNASAFLRNSTSWFNGIPDFYFPVDKTPLKAIIDRSINGKPGAFVLSQGSNGQNGSLAWFKASPMLAGNANENRFTGSSSPTIAAQGKLADGDIVLASALTASNQIILYKKNGSVSRTLSSPYGPIAIAFGHFYSDSSEDMAVLNSLSNNISLFNGSQLFTASKPYKSITLPINAPKCIVAASLRGDGYDDLIIGYDGGGYILYNKEDGTYFDTSISEKIGTIVPGSRTTETVGDLDGNGVKGDVALLNAATNNIEVYLRNDSWTGTFFNKTPSALLNPIQPISSFVLGDFGGSSATDVVALADSGKALIFIQPSFGFTQDRTPSSQLTIGQKPSAIATGDVNDDGLADLLITYQDLPSLAVYLRIGPSIFKNAFNFTSGATSSSILATDINGDLRCDITCTSPESHSISIWYQNNLVPLAKIDAPGSANEGTDVTFSGASSLDSYSDVNALNYTWNFGDSLIGYGRNVFHRYLDNDLYHVSLVVTDRGGLSNRTIADINILDKDPSATFNFSPSNPTEGQIVNFTDTSVSYPDAITNWDWYFSDTYEHKPGSTTNHTFAQQGVWAVTLTVTDDDGGVSHLTKNVVVSDTHPRVSFSTNTTSILEGGSVRFTSTSTPGLGGDPLTYWNWTFGDGKYSNLPVVNHWYANMGNYSVILKVKDSDDSSWTVSNLTIITVRDIKPKADFTWIPNNPVEMRLVTFTDASWHYANDTIVNLTWSFGDGKAGYGPIVHHIYDIAASYDVTLTIWDDDHSNSSILKVVKVNDTHPMANFTIGPSVEGSPTYFNSTTVIFAPILYYNWTFSSGPPLYGANVVKAFTQSGWYQATLTVTDVHHNSNSTTQRFWVSEFNLTVDFNSAPIAPLETQKVELTSNCTSYDPLVNWTWTIDGLAQLYGRQVNFTFDRAGLYNITLAVRDNDGSIANFTKALRVLETYPVANFTIWPRVPDEGSWVRFNDTSHASNLSGIPIVGWQWVFDNRTQNSTPDARFNFGDGDHWARLTVWDAHGASNSTPKVHFQVSNLPPTADFVVDRAVEGSVVHFNSTSTFAWNRIVRYNWTFGGYGFGENRSNVVHTFMGKGWRNITLTVWDDQGHSSSISRWIYVNSTPPNVSLQIIGSSVEGTPTLFNLTATSFNTLVSWNWSYDGNATWHLYHDAASGTTFTFAFHGPYWVSVNVTEADSDWTLMGIQVDVHDTSPNILRFWSSSLTCDMGQSVDFWATAEPTYRPIDRYEWNFDYGSGGAWVPSDPKLANHTTFNFDKPGNHFVMVRVWDNDSYSQFSTPIQIYVNDLRPVASFSYLNSTQVSGRVQFDASLSSDSPSDMASLSYRWNFGDNSGWTGYSESNKITYHDFPSDGRFTVTLQVRDQWGTVNSESLQVSQTIVVDRQGPELVMKSTGENSTAGQNIIISAQVTDAFGVRQVMLAYRLGNGIWTSIPMTPTEQPHVYAGQIPAQAENTTVYYQIHATDTTNNTYSTQVFQINVRAATEPVNDLLWIVAILVAIIVALLLFIAFRPVPVDEVFIIYQDGRLMAHQTRRLKPGMDDEILSSMLIAIQGFVKDSFKDESSTHLQRLDFGEKKILVERGESFYLAVVLHSHRAGNVPQRMQAVIADIHQEYGLALKEWDGDLEKVRGIKDQTDKLFKTPVPLSLPGLKKEKAPELSECPMCGFAVQPNARKCPSCGAELSMSTVDDLEVVAKGLEEAKDEKK